MTTGLKTPSSYYMELINTFPPRPINNEGELVATQNRINSILDKGRLTQDERDYLKVLGMLVYDYEEQHEIIPSLNGVELLNALMEESNRQPKDLVPILGNESIIVEILNNQRRLTNHQVNELAAFFQISPASLISLSD